MNIAKYISTNFLHLVIIALLITLIIMNKEKKEGFMSDTMNNILGGLAIFVVFCVIAGISMFLVKNGGIAL
jgi:hypothetical protein